MKRKEKAFTLIELLVVIAIIALLLSIIAPSLKKAKEAGRRAVCLNNVKQLAMCWHLYAMEHDEKFCSPDPADTTPGYIGWVGWKGTGWPSAWTDQQWKASITSGALWPYCQNEQIYRCPTGEKDEQITYASFASFGWSQWTGPRASDGPIIYKMNEMIQPATRCVYIDEGMLTPNFYSVYYNQEMWWDQPTDRHSEGTTFSFADGHSEHWKWVDERTKKMSRMTWDEFTRTSQHVICAGNPDLEKLRRAAWGKLPR